MQIWVQSLVKNEARFLWYSINSVIGFVDKVLLWDTGSTDKTLEIIKVLKEKYPEKIEFKEVGEMDEEKFTQVRQKMLEETKSDWFLVVDGDEIWWDESIKEVRDLINNKGNEIESIVVPTVNLVGDIYHYQEEKAGMYKLAGKKGHLNLRAVKRTIPGLKSQNPHGTWGWVDAFGRMIQDRDPKKVIFLEAPYLHASFLQRSDIAKKDIDVIKRDKKLKHELGIGFSLDYYYPEVFFKAKPEIVSHPWQNMDLGFKLRAFIETPLRKLKRRYLSGRIGY